MSTMLSEMELLSKKNFAFTFESGDKNAAMVEAVQRVTLYYKKLAESYSIKVISYKFTLKVLNEIFEIDSPLDLELPFKTIYKIYIETAFDSQMISKE